MTDSIPTPHGPVDIRPARIEDAQTFRTLRLEALQNHPLAFSSDYAVWADKPAEFWTERLEAQGEDLQIYFAVSSNALIGMCGIERSLSPKTRHSGWIWGVYLQSEWRGLRIVDHLISTCIEWGRRHGVTMVKLGVGATNLAALRSYLRCGFRIYGVEPQAIFFEGVMIDELLMAREI